MMRWYGIFFLLLFSGQACRVVAQQSTADQLWSAAERVTQTEDWSLAINTWKTIVAQPTWPYTHTREEAQLYLATAYGQVQQDAQARDLLEPVLAAHPHDDLTVRVLIVLTQARWRLGEPDAITTAIRYLADDLSWRPEQLQTLCTELIWRVGSAPPVVTALTDYLAQHPGHPRTAEFTWMAARLWDAAGERAQARQLVQQLVTDVPNPPEAPRVYTWLAADAVRQGNPQQAITLLRTALAWYPTDRDLQVTLLTACRQQGDRATMAFVLERLCRHPEQCSADAITTLYWLFQVAVTAQDQAAAQHWVDLVTAVAPEHLTAGKMRRLYKTLSNTP